CRRVSISPGALVRFPRGGVGALPRICTPSTRRRSYMSLIGKKAPEWKAVAYVKGEQKVLSSRDLEGKYYVLYWYPLDFTFVCPTEIRGFQELVDEFDDEDCVVIGASTDSFHSHKAW